MQKINPHLWFDKEAVEAAEFYTSIFPDSKILERSVIENTPSGDCDTVRFNIMGYDFMALSAGPLFKPNPSVSFMLNFDPSKDDRAREHLQEIWNSLSEKGEEAMPLGSYPFSELYGWIQDKYGISWQLILTDPAGEDRPFIIPSLLFVTDEGEKAEEAADFYVSIFKNARRGEIARYPAGMEPNKEGSVMFSDFQIGNQWFAAMDGSTQMHNFSFNEAISFMINCDSQEEIDYYWSALSAVPEAEQCGWLKDRYGISWQVVPAVMDEMMLTGTKEQKERVTQAFLGMKKFDIKQLKEAFGG